MNDAARFAYSAVDADRSDASLMPVLPLALAYNAGSREFSGLLDTGASVNVLPFSIGAALGQYGRSSAQPLC